jgi:hypothetical protein
MLRPSPQAEGHNRLPLHVGKQPPTRSEQKPKFILPTSRVLRYGEREGSCGSLRHPGRDAAIIQVNVSAMEIGGIFKSGGASVSSTFSSEVPVVTIQGQLTLFRRGLIELSPHGSRYLTRGPAV